MVTTTQLHETPPPVVAAVSPAGLAAINALLERWYFKPDFQAVRIVLGAIQAHYLNVGDPAWLFVVAPPGAGKTTMSLMGASGLSQVIPLSDFSENTFLSGFYGHPQPGLLEKLGYTVQDGKNTYTTQGNAIFLAKDFTSVLSMRREKRAVILGQLREIHDGQFKRDFGTGETKIWHGRVSIIAAVTPILDRHYSVFTVLGERFLQVRWHRPDSEEAGVRAIEQQGFEKEIQQGAQEVIGQIFRDAARAVPTLPDTMKHRLASLAEIVAIGRTHVFRRGYGNREIEYVPEPEANTRLSKGLAALAKGIAALHRRPEVAEQDLQDAFRVGLDCLPDYRRRLFLAVAQGLNLDSVGIPRTMRTRELEELSELGIVEFDSGQADGTWRLVVGIEHLWATAGVKLS